MEVFLKDLSFSFSSLSPSAPPPPLFKRGTEWGGAEGEGVNLKQALHPTRSLTEPPGCPPQGHFLSALFAPGARISCYL